MKKFYALSLAILASVSAFAAGHTVSIMPSSPISCNGVCDGAITSSVSGGVGPFTYSWVPSGGTSATASGLCAGNYTVTVTDNSDMSTATASFNLAQPTVLTVSAPGGSVCPGGCTNLSPIASGGTPAYNYIWSGGLFGPMPTVCPSTTTSYSVTVTDSHGCIAMGSTTIVVSSLPAVTVNSPTICAGMTATLTGGGALSYVWSNGATSASINVSPATTTTYTVTGTGPGGCTNTAISTVTVIPAISVSLPPTYDLCFGGATMLNATATGGSGGFTYSWSPATGLAATNIYNPACAPATTTTYTITVTDASGCTATATTTVNVGSFITTGITSTNTSMCGACDGTVTVSPMGGIAPYAYNWSTGATTATLTSLCAGIYDVLITDAMGCTVTDSITVYDGSTAAANFSIVPDSTDAYNFFCFNTSTGPGLSYTWDFADGVVSSLASPSHTYVLNATYTICLQISSATCGNDTMCYDLVVDGVLNSCNAQFNIADDTMNTDPNAHYVYNLSYGATLSYLWDFGDGTTSTLATPSHVYASTGPYLLCLSIDNGSGCTDMYCDSLFSVDSLNRTSGNLEITVYDVPPFQDVTTGIEEQNAAAVSVYPNPFSDQTTFVLSDKVSGNYSFELYDMMGKKVMDKQGITGTTFQVSRNGLSDGCYFYRIRSSEILIGKGKLMVK